MSEGRPPPQLQSVQRGNGQDFRGSWGLSAQLAMQRLLSRNAGGALWGPQRGASLHTPGAMSRTPGPSQQGHQMDALCGQARSSFTCSLARTPRRSLRARSSWALRCCMLSCGISCPQSSLRAWATSVQGHSRSAQLSSSSVLCRLLRGIHFTSMCGWRTEGMGGCIHFFRLLGSIPRVRRALCCCSLCCCSVACAPCAAAPLCDALRVAVRCGYVYACGCVAVRYCWLRGCVHGCVQVSCVAAWLCAVAVSCGCTLWLCAIWLWAVAVHCGYACGCMQPWLRAWLCAIWLRAWLRGCVRGCVAATRLRWDLDFLAHAHRPP